MRLEGLIAACAAGLLIATVGAAERDSLPPPWIRGGDVTPADKCRVAVHEVKGMPFDRELAFTCNGTATGFVSVGQRVRADSFRGKRVRLSAQMRGEGVKDWTGLWMRIDGAEGKMLLLDNMYARSFKGTFDWRPASIVLDVSPEATELVFGILQSGDGMTATGGFALDVVGKEVATTAGPQTAPAAANLTLR